MGADGAGCPSGRTIFGSPVAAEPGLPDEWECLAFIGLGWKRYQDKMQKLLFGKEMSTERRRRW